jgi:protein-disulfide isomerase
MRACLFPLVALALAACTPAPTPAAPLPPAPSAPPAASSAPAPASPVTFAPMAPRVPVSPRDLRWGDPQAPVTAVLFGQLSEPGARTVLRRLLKVQKALGPAAVAVVWKFHKFKTTIPQEERLARAALALWAAGEEEAARAFLMAATQPHELDTDGKMEEAARAAGARDAGALLRGLEAEGLEAQLRGDEELGSRLSVEQTPVVFVNGYRLGGLTQVSELKARIEEETSLVEELRKGGKTRDIYALRTQQNAGNEQNAPWTTPGLTPGARRRVELGDSPRLGSAKAPVTLVMFGGYQDPFSRRAWGTLAALRKRYRDDLRIVWKDAPLEFHRASMHLAAMAREARVRKGDAGFWQASEVMLKDTFWRRYQQPLSASEPSAATLQAVALELGIPGGGGSSVKYGAAIDAERRAWKSLGSTGTPSFFINGRFLSGAQPEQTFRAVIDDELSAALGLIRRGAKPEEVYDLIMAQIANDEEE